MPTPVIATKETPIPDALLELALNMRWSWNHSADELWIQLDPELWELTQNPWLILQTISHEKLRQVTSNPRFGDKLQELIGEKRDRERSVRWFHDAHSGSPLTAVAYFSLEFLLSEALPIYSGGLGNVAGDQLKAASDLGLPVIGVGLLYQQGYFRQLIDSQGRQQAVYPFNDPGQLPIQPVRDQTGEWVRVPIQFPGCKLWIRAWEAQVGRTKLFLLDTNDPANLPEYRGITSQLYGGGPDLRISQEQVLGIAGWRLLRMLGIQPEVCHLNEGHAAFAILERAQAYMADTNQPFELALAVTRAGNVFTTHTPVAAGFDRFTPELMRVHFEHYAQSRLRISMNDLLALGRQNPSDSSEPFSMAYLALRGSGAVNGVSRLHGQVSRRIFQGLFPRWPELEVPVQHVTNGVHVPTWDSAEADALWTEACGKQRWRGDLANLQQDVRNLSNGRLWRMRSAARSALIEYVRQRLARQLAGQAASVEAMDAAANIFHPETLTIGFARRFASYKRPNLLLYDPDRLLRILTNAKRPVQLILAGKAHPQDIDGQRLIEQWISWIRHTEARSKAVFLSDYDMHLTQHLVQGVDLWLNTPRRPWEACGTSGMKVLVNGGINLSELDGWWAEAYSPELGWALGDGQEHGDDPAWDAVEANQLYDLLEREIIPEFYDRDAAGLPFAWIQRMRESMARLTPEFSANRCVREYTESFYLPCAADYLRRREDEARIAREVLEWTKQLRDCWSQVRFGSLSVKTEGNHHSFAVEVYFGNLDENAVRVELYADPQGGEDSIRTRMTKKACDCRAGFNYVASVSSDRPANHFTPRVVPYCLGAKVPLEASQVLWYR